MKANGKSKTKKIEHLGDDASIAETVRYHTNALLRRRPYIEFHDLISLLHDLMPTKRLACHYIFSSLLVQGSKFGAFTDEDGVFITKI